VGEAGTENYTKTFYTMSLLRTVGVGIAWNSLASLMVRAFALANVFLILTRLSVYEYGLVQLILSVFSTTAIFLLPGLISSVVADIARTREEGRAADAALLARHYVLLQFILGVAGFCVLHFGAGALTHYLNLEHVGNFLSIVALLFLVNPITSITLMLANAELRFKLQAAVSMVEEVSKFVWMSVLFYGFGFGASGVLWAMVLAPLTGGILLLPWTFSLFLPLFTQKTRKNFSFWTIFRAHRRWGIATSYLGTLNQNIRIWTVQILLGTEAVGLYSFAYGILSQAGSLITFSQVANPLLARAAATGVRLADYANRVFKYHIWFVLLALPFGLLVAPYFVSILFPEYVPAIHATMIMLLALIPSAAAVVSTSVYPALKLQKDFFRAMVLKVTLTAVTLPLLVMGFGLVGAALEIVLTNSISVFERTRSLRKHLPGFLRPLRLLITVDGADRGAITRTIGQLKARIPKRKTV
jgi:O-antigen/teichoic acid export membrane protein